MIPSTSTSWRRNALAAVEITALAAGAGPPANRMATRRIAVRSLGGWDKVVMVESSSRDIPYSEAEMPNYLDPPPVATNLCPHLRRRRAGSTRPSPKALKQRSRRPEQGHPPALPAGGLLRNADGSWLESDRMRWDEDPHQAG